jgi:MoaA/NifB/PqqE/SkfB family radical SAM enzyme
MRSRTVAFSKKASNLFFHILTQCNLSCSHCYINPEQHGRAMLDIQTIESWLTLFKKQAPTTHLVILGGEPTLHPDLGQMVKTARGMRFKSITIDTNGYLFNNILEKITPDDIDFLSFSLDGATAQTNDLIRGKGCYDAVITGIQSARKKKFSCSMIYTVSDQNIHELELMPAIVKDLGVERFFIQVIGMRGESAKAHGPLQVDKKNWESIVPHVAGKIAQQGIKVVYPVVFLDHDQVFECAGNVATNYFIFPNGRVYQCPLCEDFALHSFSIKNNALARMPRINETDLFKLSIPEGCVINKMVQPGNLTYDEQSNPCYKIACCLLKQALP